MSDPARLDQGTVYSIEIPNEPQHFGEVAGPMFLALLSFCVPGVAQDLPDNPDASAIADSQMLGAVHTTGGVPIPGSP